MVLGRCLCNVVLMGALHILSSILREPTPYIISFLTNINRFLKLVQRTYSFGICFLFREFGVDNEASHDPPT